MMYIKEEFDLRHYRRDYISSEYKTNNGNNCNGDMEQSTNKKLDNEQNHMDDDGNESIILDECSECDDESYIASNDTTEDDQIDYEADNYCTTNQKQATYYK